MAKTQHMVVCQGGYPHYPQDIHIACQNVGKSPTR